MAVLVVGEARQVVVTVVEMLPLTLNDNTVMIIKCRCFPVANLRRVKCVELDVFPVD